MLVGFAFGAAAGAAGAAGAFAMRAARIFAAAAVLLTNHLKPFGANDLTRRATHF